MTRWRMTANGITVQSINGELPEQIEQIRQYVDDNKGFVPIKPYLSSLEYDENKPETILAAAYAWLEKTAQMPPIVETDGIDMPEYTESDSGLIY